jgi:hypothetical protein
MLGIHRTTTTMPARRALVRTCGRPAHRRRRAWKVEYLEERSLLSLFSVTNLNDSGGGSLRQAIIDSNNNTTNGPNEIDFAPGLSGTIKLTTGELLIANYDLKIVGPGQGTLSVSGNGNSRVFEIASGVTASLSGITITDGKAENGGGVYNIGSLNLDGCTVASNVATHSTWPPSFGGGIYNSGTLTVNDSTLSGNSAGSGGGIGTFGTLTIATSTISGNSAWYSGGGIENSGRATITASTIVGNSADRGGGIFDESWGGRTIITTSTIVGNSATDGGGILNYGWVTITDSTVGGNSAKGDGGGIRNDYFEFYNPPMPFPWQVGGTMTLTNSTVSRNSADGAGGGIANLFYRDSVTILTSILAGNVAPTVPDVSGAFDSMGHNLIGNTAGTSGWDSTDLLNVDPKLGPLQYNGGSTMTMALLPGSPAIDKGSNDLIPPGVQYDQRGAGFNRIVNGTVDIGDHEFLPAINHAVSVGWGAQTASLQTAADGLRLLPAGRSTDLPWLGVNRFQLTLGQAQSLSPTDVTVNSAIGINYGPVTVSGSGTSYTITLARPIDVADRLTITIVNPGISMFNRRIDVVPGDVNDDGVVSASDVVLIRNAILKTGDPLMIGWCDLDGNGAVDMTDFSLARKRLGTHLH